MVHDIGDLTTSVPVEKDGRARGGRDRQPVWQEPEGRQWTPRSRRARLKVPSIVNTKAETQEQRALAMIDFKRVGRCIREQCPVCAPDASVDVRWLTARYRNA